MILVTVGTLHLPFPRLIRACRELEELDDELVVQCGPCADRPFRAAFWDYLPPHILSGLALEARVVITHAGIGSVSNALAAGRRPLVMPRRRCFGEHVDDHQVQFSARLEQLGYVTLLERLPVGLGEYLEGASLDAPQVHQPVTLVEAVRGAISRYAYPRPAGSSRLARAPL